MQKRRKSESEASSPVMAALSKSKARSRGFPWLIHHRHLSLPLARRPPRLYRVYSPALHLRSNARPFPFARIVFYTAPVELLTLSPSFSVAPPLQRASHPFLETSELPPHPFFCRDDVMCREIIRRACPKWLLIRR